MPRTIPLNEPTTSVASEPVRSHRTGNVTWGLLALLCVTLFYAFAVIRNFSGPIGDYSESFLYEYLPWYASRHLSLWPIPQLSLHTNEVLYPFGGNVALQSWCVERDILFALLKPSFPNAPLLQIYYLLGVAISTLGSYLLLLPRHGAQRAALTALIAHAFNFYSMQKYAYHYNIACYHWTTLGIVCDFVIVSRVLAERTVSLRLLLLRVLLLVLAFGLELGHVLGYSLTSVLFASGYLLWFVIREVRAGRLSIPDTLQQWRIEAKAHRTLLTLLIISTVAVAWIYLSVTAGIVRDSLAMGRFPGHSGVWWAVPLRLLLPYTPWLHPSMQPLFLHVLGDVAETGIGGGSPGLFLLLIGMAGIYQSKAYRSRSAHFPLFACFVLYVGSGAYLPLLKLLPWFSFCRVYSRATLVYSTILALFAVDMSVRSLRPMRRYVAFFFIAAIGTLELATIVRIKGEHPTYSFSGQQLSYFDTIKRHPGEAILDFPFCLLGGNGDIAGLCPYWERNKGVYALARFHEKKVIGQYLGRLHPSQAAPFVEQGWDELYEPDSRDIQRATRQVRCLTEDEWTFFEQFYLYNDFAGIQLATDLLPSGCAEQFYARFGQPTARIELRGLGPLSFVAKPAALRSQVDPERGKQVRLQPHDPGRFVRRYTALDLQRTDERAIAIRHDLHGQPTEFEFLAGKYGAIFGPYDRLPAGEYVVRFDLELTNPAMGKVATLDMTGGLGESTYGSGEVRAEQLTFGRTEIGFSAQLPKKSTGIEVRLHSHGAGLVVHGVTVRRIGPPQ